MFRGNSMNDKVNEDIEYLKTQLANSRDDNSRLIGAVADLADSVVDLARRVEALERDKNFIAFGRRGPDGKIWTAGYTDLARWKDISTEPNVVALSYPTDSDQAGQIAVGFDDAANRGAGTA